MKDPYENQVFFHSCIPCCCLCYRSHDIFERIGFPWWRIVGNASRENLSTISKGCSCNTCTKILPYIFKMVRIIKKLDVKSLSKCDCDNIAQKLYMCCVYYVFLSSKLLTHSIALCVAIKHFQFKRPFTK